MDTTGKRILFVSTKKTLIANALMNKIKLRGAVPLCVQDAQQFSEAAAQPTDGVVYCMDDDARECAALHGAMDAFCSRHGAGVVCVGSREQYDAFLESFAPERVAGFFERPLDIERFLDCVVGKADAAARRKRVLIVDDDANYREFVREWLKDVYNVSMANGGEQAMKVLAVQKCDLILLDYEMPVVSGPETMERIQALPRAERPPVIFLTGNDDEACVERVLDLHPAGYLLKTARREELLAKAAEVLAET